MKAVLFAALFLAHLSLVPATTLAQTKSFEGSWFGKLEIGGPGLRLLLKVTAKPDGSLAATLDSLDQGAKDIPVDVVGVKGATVTFSIKRLLVDFEGNMNAAGDEISGSFKQGQSNIPLVLKRTVGPIALNRPQEPKPPFPYVSEDVTYRNSAENTKLAGTLTVPKEGGPFAAVLLITGSGSQDRNETIAGHKPFLVIADYLARRGIAVLRVDDRGVGGSDIGPRTATSENFVGDVLAGVAYLKSRKEIDAKRIGLIGHSEGGMIAPMAAARSKDVAFIVLLAGIGQTGADVIYGQTALLQKAGGAPQSVTDMTVAALRAIADILKTEPDDKLASEKIRSAFAAQAKSLPADQQPVFAEIEKSLEPQIPMYTSAWFRYFLQYDPAPVLRKVKVPVLALSGENDLQVSYKENLAGIAGSLKKAGNRDVTTRSFPKLNHLFQTSKTGSPSEYGAIEETMAPEVLQTMADWIVKRFGKR